jgi:hypothetical protein
MVYFPMAFLSVAIVGSLLAANPAQVLPAICKAPLAYLVTLVVLALLLAVRGYGGEVILENFPRGLSTHSTNQLVGYLASQAAWTLLSLYLLTVSARILGLLYHTKSHKFGWGTK